MRTALSITRFIVGVLFIISGLVKANDPLGLSYKMQEFFELWNGELASSSFFARKAFIGLFEFLHGQSLALSVGMITLEIVAGAALLLGWMRNFILWLLLILIVFFTFLTGYAYLSGKFTNCGCFGDCLPITPLASFLKDIALLVLIGILLAGRRQLKPVLRPATRTAVVAAVLLLSLGLQWYVLQYLPLADCLPFRREASIPQGMKPPPGSVTDSFAIRFLYEKGGKRYSFSMEELPDDIGTYKYLDREDRLVRKGNAEPAIKGFSLSGGSGADSTTEVLQQPAAVLVFAQQLRQPDLKNGLAALAAAAQKRGLPVYLATPSATQAAADLGSAIPAGLQLFNTDFTIVRTAARTNPTVYFLRAGTVAKKYSGKRIGQAAADLQNFQP